MLRCLWRPVFPLRRSYWRTPKLNPNSHHDAQLVDLVFEWCRGKRFVELMAMTKQYEGSIIRMLHRLDELMRQLMTAAKTIGDAELEDKCARGGAMLRRDIVFAASLYLDDVTQPRPAHRHPPMEMAVVVP